MKQRKNSKAAPTKPADPAPIWADADSEATYARAKANPDDIMANCEAAVANAHAHYAHGVANPAKNETPQAVMDNVNSFARTIEKVLSRFAYRQDATDLKSIYVTSRWFIELWRKEAEPCFRVSLPDLPDLPGNDFYAGMVNLATFCTKAAKRLGAPQAAPGQARLTLPRPSS